VEHYNQELAGLEFSLQAALTLSRLKPVLHACFGGQPGVRVWSSAFRLHCVRAG